MVGSSRMLGRSIRGLEYSPTISLKTGTMIAGMPALVLNLEPVLGTC
jgi:hypothetical protein